MTSFQEVSCFNSDDSDLDPNFVPAVLDESEDADPEDVVEAQITSLKSLTQKMQPSKNLRKREGKCCFRKEIKTII